MKNRVLSEIFPKRCPFCRRLIPAKQDICDGCTKKLPEEVYRKFAIGGFPCSAALLYKNEYAEAVKKFKIGKKKYYAHPLAVLASGAAARVYDLSTFDYITCVPMHRLSLKKERFNHAELLAKEIAKITGIPFADALEKYKMNKPQHSLKRSERADNVRGVYRVKDKSVVKGKRFLLVDDIITTGNTLGECARILKKAGCAEVCCAAVCAVSA